MLINSKDSANYGSETNEMRDELSRLMLEQIESLRRATFVGISEEQLRIKRIRELSADFLSALKRDDL